MLYIFILLPPEENGYTYIVKCIKFDDGESKAYEEYMKLEEVKETETNKPQFTVHICS